MPAWNGVGLITGTADAKRAVEKINHSYRGGTDALARAVRTADEAGLVPDAFRLVPAIPELDPVLPWPGGLLRGATVAAVGSSSLQLALLAGGISQGGWAAVIGQPWFGVNAAQEYGVPLDRLALVPDPGPDWPTVVGALIDGVDMLVVTVPDPGAGTVRSLQARARERGCVLIPTRSWPGSDLVLERTAVEWAGLGRGRGRLKWQKATLRASGRGRAAKPRTLEMIFPPLSVLHEQGRLVSDLTCVPWGSASLQPPARQQQSPPTPQGPTAKDRGVTHDKQNDLWANLTPNVSPNDVRSLW